MHRAEQWLRKVLRLDPSPNSEQIEPPPFAREAREKRLASIQRERARTRQRTGNIVEETIFVTAPATPRKEHR